VQLRERIFLMAISFAYMPEVLAQNYTNGPTLGTIAGNINRSLGGVALLAEGIAYTAGFFLGLGSLFKFKAYRDNPQQTPLGVPINWLAVAVCLCALPMIFGSGITTMFGAVGADGFTKAPPAPGQRVF
jgi:hypothetical protein